MQALTRLQNHLNQVRFVGQYQRKGPFLKTVLLILKPNKVEWIIFQLFLIIQTLDYQRQSKNLKFDSI